MGFASMWSSLKGGEFREAFINALISEDALETQAMVQSAQEAQIAAKYNQGLIDEEQAMDFTKMAQGSAYSFLAKNEPGGDPASVFANSVKERITKLFNNALGAPARLLPWWLWALFGLGVIIYFWPFLRAALALRARIAK